MNLKAQATEVAQDLRKTGVVIELLSLIELVYYSYELFKECQPDPVKAKAYLQGEYDGENFSRQVMRPAVRQVRRAVRQKGLDVNDEQMEQIAKASLMKAMNAGDDVVAACYAE